MSDLAWWVHIDGGPPPRRAAVAAEPRAKVV
eukprot:SAG31_NODE_3280_length_4470_cov_7.297644_1_plen_30_part_10